MRGPFRSSPGPSVRSRSCSRSGAVVCARSVRLAGRIDLAVPVHRWEPHRGRRAARGRLSSGEPGLVYEGDGTARFEGAIDFEHGRFRSRSTSPRSRSCSPTRECAPVIRRSSARRVLRWIRSTIASPCGAARRGACSPAVTASSGTASRKRARSRRARAYRRALEMGTRRDVAGPPDSRGRYYFGTPAQREGAAVRRARRDKGQFRDARFVEFAEPSFDHRFVLARASPPPAGASRPRLARERERDARILGGVRGGEIDVVLAVLHVGAVGLQHARVRAGLRRTLRAASSDRGRARRRGRALRRGRRC